MEKLIDSTGTSVSLSVITRCVSGNPMAAMTGRNLPGVARKRYNPDGGAAMRRAVEQ